MPFRDIIYRKTGFSLVGTIPFVTHCFDDLIDKKSFPYIFIILCNKILLIEFDILYLFLVENYEFIEKELQIHKNPNSLFLITLFISPNRIKK